jgi:hypothetical protein
MWKSLAIILSRSDVIGNLKSPLSTPTDSGRDHQTPVYSGCMGEIQLVSSKAIV